MAGETAGPGQGVPSNWDRRDWVTSPGEIIQEELEDEGETAADLARQIDEPLPLVERLIAGAEPVSTGLARKLQGYFGVSARFWLDCEKAYRERRGQGGGQDCG